MSAFLRYFALPALIGGAVGLALVWFSNIETAPANGYADAVALAAPSVVNIYSSKIPNRSHPICDVPQFRYLCEKSDQRVLSSLGSGVIVRGDGYIVTNNHVIQGADEILIAFQDGRQAQAELVGSDAETDLAVVRVVESSLTPIAKASSADARVGDVVLAIGNPFGIGQTVSLGIVSAKGRYGITPFAYDDFIQTDAAINPGNSGGALINAEGGLVGINTLIYNRSDGSEGIGFAIPSDLAHGVIEEIVEKGYVERGWLGVGLARQPPPGQQSGLLVKDVYLNSPAQAAGLCPGDYIVAIEGTPALDSREVIHQVAMLEPGSVMQINVVRDGAPFRVEAASGLRPPPTETPPTVGCRR